MSEKTHFNVTDVNVHRRRIRSKDLLLARSCLLVAFEGNMSKTVSHRAPFREGYVVINDLPNGRSPVTRRKSTPRDMKTGNFDIQLGEDGSLQVRAQFPAGGIEGFEVHESGLRGEVQRISTKSAAGFVAIIGSEGRIFGVATTDQEGEVIESLPKDVAFAITSHGLERAFRCKD